jgi:hypothetical protein
MATFTKFENFSEDLASKVHNFAAAGDTLKVYLSNAAPNVATHEVKSDVAEITMTNELNHGAGGGDVENDVSRSGGVTSVTGVDVTFEADGGTVGPFRYAVLYNDTPTSPADPLIGYWDYGSEVTLQDGETFLVDVGSSLFTVT